MHHGEDQDMISILLVENDMTAVLMSAHAISKHGSLSPHARIRYQHRETIFQIQSVAFRLPGTELLNTIKVDM